MAQFKFEITDTYAGEANYTWVRHYTIQANTMRGAVQKLAREHGSGWRKEYDAGDVTRYNLQGACICMFVEEVSA